MAIDMSQHFTLPQLVRYALPSIAMVIFTSIYYIVDGIFVANFAGKTAFAAVNLIMPYIMILSVTGFMIGTGGSAVVSKARGEGRHEEANQYFSMLVYFAFGLGCVLAVIGWFTVLPVAEAFGAKGEMAQLCMTYARILMLSLPFFTLQYVFQALFPTAGKPRIGFLVIVAAGVTNIVLDGVFVAWLGWGTEGAALASVAGEIIGGGLPLIYFFRQNDSFLRLIPTKFNFRVLARACFNGSSEMVANISVNIVAMLYNLQLMAMLGEDGVAAYGVIMYSSLIFLAVFMGYNMGVSPILSFQYGAKNTVEMRSIMLRSVGFMVVAGVAMVCACELLAAPFAHIFAAGDNTLFEITVHGFRIFAFSYLFLGYAIYGSAFFTALNNGLVSAALSFLRTLVFETSCVILVPMAFGVDGLWAAVAVAEAIGVVVTAFVMAALAGVYGYGRGAKQESAGIA